ncbi:endo alpha-1,4 polygalactosaminidase [Anaerotalea alkaliphila]|uniref:Endo alpha-1,4 polygalactosaminidase n=1 Tax=Anaerotalea alkaliphila TaxID=2662126 RepID=A0A7X5HXZ8_9FIRM|nr:endo alpha-1,4 polygalactosaminidase [Anaerotalea alkaliphila]NDL68707.1 endo alpha-1,4 polygalactosaminidase [Anaerotalea alkaliphila]
MIRKMLMLLLVAAMFLAATSLTMNDRDRGILANDGNPIWNANNFLVYYSVIKSQDVRRITSYDLAIIDSLGVSNQILARLKASDTLLYSYVSVVSVEKSDTLKTGMMEEGDYLHINGERLYNTAYDCYYGDILSESYRNILLRIIKERVVDRGFDGVFFDTMDDIEHLSDPKVRQAQFDGHLRLLEQIKELYPNLSIIQNRAFNFYEQGAARYLDGLLYEDLDYRSHSISDYSKETFDSLVSVAKEFDNVILAISNENREENHAFCIRHRWLYYYCPVSNNYLEFEEGIDNVYLDHEADASPDSGN